MKLARKMVKKTNFLLFSLIAALIASPAYSVTVTKTYVDKQDKSLQTNILLLRDMLNTKDSSGAWLTLDTEAKLAIPAINELKAALDSKANVGDVLTADSLTELNEAVAALESGKATVADLEALQATVDALGDTYATDDEVSTAIANVQSAIDNIDLSAYAKTADLASVATSGSYADLTNKPDIPSIDGLATDQDLTDLRSALETEIANKQIAGDYLVASDLTELSDAIAALQSGKADASTITTIQETISKLGDTYATKSDMTAADTALQNAIDAIEIPSLADYAKTADVEAALALKADKSELTNLVTNTQLTELRTALETEIAKKQDSGDYAAADALTAISTELSTLKGDVYTKAQVDAKIADAVSGGEIDLSGYAKQVDLDSLTALVNGNTAEITTLKNAGYQTSTQVSEAIAAATATLATKDELNAKQDTLTAGAGITITDNTISASVDTSSFVPNPTATPTTSAAAIKPIESPNGIFTPPSDYFSVIYLLL